MVKIIISNDLDADQEKKSQISRHIYGHFSEHLGRCIYDGFWVGENSDIPNTRGIRNDIIHALKNINIPNLRWPGGCFADEYHWKDGIGPRESRPSMLNTHWGGVVENNHFGTHEFLDLCEQLGCEPYISGNVGSGTIQEMAQWIEYLSADKGPMSDLRRANGRESPWKVKYWGVGNENWGCGGNMRAEYYTNLFFRYSTYCRNYSNNKLYKIACGPVSALPMSWVKNWVEVLMKRAKPYLTLGSELLEMPIHGISFHHYTTLGQIRQGSATDFSEKEWIKIMRNALYMEKLLKNICEVMDKYDPKKQIGLIVDEWGTWHAVEPGTNPRFLYQQNTMRDAVMAALTLNIFNTNCDRVHMANLAQTVNVLQAPILTKGDKMILTPTYHVFEMFKVHHDTKLLPIDIKSENYKRGGVSLPAIHGTASKNRLKKINISLCNIDPTTTYDVSIELPQIELKEKNYNARLLRTERMNAHNTFDSPNDVKPTEYNSSNFNINGSNLSFKMPSMAVIIIEIE